MRVDVSPQDRTCHPRTADVPPQASNSFVLRRRTYGTRKVNVPLREVGACQKGEGTPFLGLRVFLPTHHKPCPGNNTPPESRGPKTRAPRQRGVTLPSFRVLSTPPTSTGGSGRRRGSDAWGEWGGTRVVHALKGHRWYSLPVSDH